MRAAQSKGIVDLLALWPEEDVAPARWVESTKSYRYVGNSMYRAVERPWLVQCKYSIHGGGTISPADRAELTALASLTGAVPVVATPGKNGRGIEFVNLHSKEPI